MVKFFRLGLLTVIFGLLIPAHAISQEFDSPFGKGKINRNFCVRGELGWNKSWFTSLGASYVFSNVNSHSPFSLVSYIAAEADLPTYGARNTFYAYKGGFEFAGMLFGLGVEFRNNTDFAGNNHLIFTPRIGLSIFGHLNFYYGYNVFRDANNIFGIGHNQWSLNVNLNRRIFKESLVPGH
jgi:hypothetical protein